MGLVEQNISFQMIPIMSHGDRINIKEVIHNMNIQESGPIEIGKCLIIYYVLTYEGKITTGTGNCDY